MKQQRQIIIRPGTPDDLKAVANVHRRAFEGFFMSSLGGLYLRRYYALILEFRRGILEVAEVDGEVVGFVAGYVGERWFEGLLRENWFGLTMRVLPIVFIRPRLIKSLLKIAWSNVFAGQPRGKMTKKESLKADLAWLAVDPDARRLGLGRKLVKAFAEASWDLGADTVHLTTAMEANPAANAFYRKLGFSVYRTYEMVGREMNEYAIFMNEEGQGLAEEEDKAEIVDEDGEVIDDVEVVEDDEDEDQA